MTIVPVYDYMLVPHATVYVQTERYKNSSGVVPEAGEQLVFVVLKEEQDWDEIRDDSFYPIGVAGEIVSVSKEGYLEIRTGDRVDLKSIHVSGKYKMEVNIGHREDIDDLDPQVEEEHFGKMKRELNRFVENLQWGQMAKNYIAQFHTIAELTAALSPWFTNTNHEKYEILEKDSRKERMEAMEKMVYEYLEITKLTNEAESEHEQDNQKIYRKQAIQRQIQYLQKQLDEMDPESVSDVRKFELKIEDSGMNETAKKEAEKVLNRLRQEGQNSAESGMLYDYLDFVTGLSWKKETMEDIDLKEAEQILDEDHFGLKKVKERVIQQIAVMNLKHRQSGSILLFVGAPGTGKTSIGRSIARALKRKYVRVSLGGVRDEADIRGHRRTYIGAMPGRIMDGIQKSGVSNPVMVLDEVDKLSTSYNGDPASALLEVLDPEQNNTFTDHYMNVPYDLSDVLFICTANTIDTIPEPLLNRMEVIQFTGYTPNDKLQIAKRHLIPKSMEAVGINEGELEIPDDTLRAIISDYTMEAGVRGLKKRLDTLCRSAAVKIVRGDTSKVTVQPGDLRDAFDTRPVSHDHILAEKKPGIVTGLAWTRVGGEILFIETMFTKGSGKVILTGQLGDVMKESAQIAISLVKSMYPDKASLFEENDLHIHVPEGAVQKDGPSAGITLTTALTSLVTGIPVSPEFAMTGEVSLRGVVTPIGGLPEKLMAAQRAGISTVFIPKENEEDLRDVDEEVREKLNIIPVSRVTDVLMKTGLMADCSDAAC
ncbi:MAG: endopeptidase La [Anaerovoracaceae bacterium]|jgi:ATP-dependent Lon protease